MNQILPFLAVENSTEELQTININLLETPENIKFHTKAEAIAPVENLLISVEKMGIKWGEEKGLWGKNSAT